jgi:prepilin-type N-terminal cleavage/methylation domain-containing protein/prepilin-type processing-associated H-X9-DG protein
MPEAGATPARGRAAGFTLIELLVVIAIIVLLMSILLPSLGQAREQGRQTKCLANLMQISIAMHSYFNDENDWFPFEKRNEVIPGEVHPSLHGFYYGGHPGRQDAPGSDQWWGYVQPPFRDTPRGRPFNPYIYPDLPDYDVPPEDPLYEIVRNLPVFACPSDDGGFWMWYGGDFPNAPNLYWFSGNSYDCNYHFARNWARAKFAGEQPVRWLQRANAFLRVQRMKHASTFIIIYEDPFDSAQWLRIPRRGWHRGWMRNNLLFLDGHAASVRTDTTQGSRGLGWKSASGNDPDDPLAWWNDPHDPDHEYRNIVPLAGY